MQCPECGGGMRLIPQGVSKKTGKPYQAFYSCEDRECGKTLPAKSVPKKQETPKEKVDWDAKERRIVRQSMIKASVEYAKTNPDIKLKDVKIIAEDWVTYVYQGLKE